MPPMTDVVKNLLIINVLFFVATMIFGETQMFSLMALYFPASDMFKPLQLVTHFFMHGGFFHIAFNMFALVMFGSALEHLWGPKRFLFFYLVCAFGAAILHMGVTWWEVGPVMEAMESFRQQASIDVFRQFVYSTPLDELMLETGAGAKIMAHDYASQVLQDMSGGLTEDNIEAARKLMELWFESKADVPVVGASGAVYGLLLGFGMNFPNVELMLIFLPVPIKAKFFIPVLMLIEIFLGFNQFSWDNIAHFAHLGGALTGFLLILYWRKFGSKF